jgi:hypothetical protein
MFGRPPGIRTRTLSIMNRLHGTNYARGLLLYTLLLNCCINYNTLFLFCQQVNYFLDCMLRSLSTLPCLCIHYTAN